MKRIIITVITTLVVMLSVNGWAQEGEMNQAEARELLDAMSAKIKKYEYMTINFSARLVNRRTNEKSTRNGTLLVKGDKYTLDLGDFVTYNDTKTLYLWQKEGGEVDISDPDPGAEGDLSPSKLFSAYSNGYKMRLLGEREINGVLCTEVDLYPEVSKNNIIRVRLSINSKTNVPYQFLQQSKNGEDLTITFNSYDTTTAIADEAFTFDISKHPEVEVVDLR